jgi:methionyl-tRNA formyltransferase
MRLVFAGTPEVAVPTLERLAGSGHEIVAVITRPDAPLGRKRVLTPSPVANAAERLGLKVIRASRLTDDIGADIAALSPDLGVIVAYGGFVREPLLSTPRHGWINLHFSLLPRWRGAAPVQRALLAGDTETGATVFRLELGMDTGPIFDTMRVAIEPEETAGQLLARLAVDGTVVVSRVVDAIAAGTASAVEQSGAATTAPKLSIDDARIDWAQPAASVHDRIRGVTPEPGAYTFLAEERLKVLRVARAADQAVLTPGQIVAAGSQVLIGTGTEPLELLEVQPSGSRAQPAADWWRGVRHDEVTAQ